MITDEITDTDECLCPVQQGTGRMYMGGQACVRCGRVIHTKESRRLATARERERRREREESYPNLWSGKKSGTPKPSTGEAIGAPLDETGGGIEWLDDIVSGEEVS